MFSGTTLIVGLLALIVGFFVGLQIGHLPSKDKDDRVYLSKEEYDKAQAILEKDSEENQALAKEASEISKGFNK